MAKQSESFYQRLTRLFKSGPAIQRRIKGYDTRSNYSSQLIQGNYGYRASAPMGFGRENSPFSVIGSYGILDRMARYAEFSEMEYVPEIATSLDIISDEVVGGDDRGKCFHVYSNNNEIKKSLDELFYDIMNVEFNLKTWCRNLVKYGDFFLYHEVLPDIGIVTVTPIPVNELEREEGYDPDDPFAVRFKWLSRGNKYLEKWQVSHFRIQSNDLFLPYGTSVLESARRINRQLQLLEDAMLVYRIVRSPERRVFYIDVGNIDPNDVENYMEAAKSTLRTQSVTDRETGREDGRLNAMSVLDDYFIPVRGNQQGTKIDTISGATNSTATEDVEYIQSKLFSALQVPKPYLNFDENLSAKATLSQMDVRFSRTIQGLQKIVLAELNLVAMIHLYSKGYDGADLTDFELKLSNPSSVALQQKLELWEVKFTLGGTATETGLVSKEWVRRNILELSSEEIKIIEKQMIEDKIRELELEALEVQEWDESQPAKTTDAFDPTNYDLRGEEIPKGPVNASDISDIGLNKFRLPDDEESPFVANLDNGRTPIKATPFMTRYRRNSKRRVGISKGRQNTAMPDINAMLSPKNKYAKDIYGTKTETLLGFYKKLLKESDEAIKKELRPKTDDYDILINPRLDKTTQRMFKQLESFIHDKKKSVLGEEIDIDVILDDDQEDEFSAINNKILLEIDNDKSGSVLLSEAVFGITSEKFDLDDDDKLFEEKSLSAVFQDEE